MILAGSDQSSILLIAAQEGMLSRDISRPYKRVYFDSSRGLFSCIYSLGSSPGSESEK